MFNKSLFNKEMEDSKKNNEFTEEDYDQINKEISKALSQMKKEKQDNDENDNEEGIEEAEPNKELNNFDYDFFSENSNSISNDNISDILDNSFKSANVEMNRNNSLKINMIKSDFKANNKINNNNNNNFSGITKEGSSSSNEFNGSLIDLSNPDNLRILRNLSMQLSESNNLVQINNIFDGLLFDFDSKEANPDIAERIGTYETSILPYEDCCTIFVAEHPVTKPRLDVIEKSEENLKDVIDDLMKQALESVEVVMCE